MKLRYLTTISGLILFISASGVNAAELQPPKVGTRMVWQCEGPFAREYNVEVAQINKGIVLYQGSIDGDTYWVEKPAMLTGTTLWTKKIGDRFQWWDEEDFQGLEYLKPGSRFKGAVPAKEGNDKWVWQYVISVGQPQRVKHRALGEALLIPISEQRRVLHGEYWSNNTSYVEPNLGITVKWTYEDSRGHENCDLVKLTGKGGRTTN